MPPRPPAPRLPCDPPPAPAAPVEMLLARAEAMLRVVSPTMPPMAPERAAELVERARRLEDAGDREAAIAALSRAAKAPSHAGAALVEIGRLERQAGRAHDALTTYKRALHHVEEPRQLAALFAEIGQLYFAMREDEEAEYYFRRAARLDARHAGLLERTENEWSAELHAATS
ncbi:MAG: hypothetical protein KF729_09005 [Sandaracinaceae bacterium]|nr:hypothetical protein [Sandaracinaceae bacterium]